MVFRRFPWLITPRSYLSDKSTTERFKSGSHSRKGKFLTTHPYIRTWWLQLGWQPSPRPPPNLQYFGPVSETMAPKMILKTSIRFHAYHVYCIWQMNFVPLIGLIGFAWPTTLLWTTVCLIFEPCCKQYMYCWQGNEAGLHSWLAPGCYDDLSNGLYNLLSTAAYTHSHTPHFGDNVCLRHVFLIKGLCSYQCYTHPCEMHCDYPSDYF